MTRRARMGPIQTLGRGVDRMAPGGRRSASESPVRPFHRPVGEAGEAPAAVPPSLAWVGTGGINPATGNMSWSAVRLAGDTYITLACGLTALTPPAGWTVLNSGTMPGQAGETYVWSVTRGVSAAGGAFGGIEGTYTGFTASRVVAFGYCYRMAGHTFELTAPTVTVGPVTTAAFVDVAGTALIQPVQTMFAASTTGGAVVAAYRPDPGITTRSHILPLLEARGSSPMFAGSFRGPYPNVPQYMDFASASSAVSISWGFEES